MRAVFKLGVLVCLGLLSLTDCNRMEVRSSPASMAAPSAILSEPIASSPESTIQATQVPVPTLEQAENVVFTVDVIPASAQTRFLIDELRVYPEEALMGQDVRITVTLTNPGQQQSTYTVLIRRNDVILETQDVVINGNQTGTVELKIVPEENCGYYRVTAGNITRRLGIFY